jgi:hypothetical protein
LEKKKDTKNEEQTGRKKGAGKRGNTSASYTKIKSSTRK